MITYKKNNINCLRSYTYDTWKQIEMIVNNLISIDEIEHERLTTLLRVITPSGETLVSKLVKSNL